MRIVIDGMPMLTSNMGGIGYYCYNIVKNMKALVSEDQYDILYNTSKHRKKLEVGEQYISYPYRKILKYIGPRLFYNIPLERHIGEFDIYHGTESYILPVKKAKTVVTIHDLEFVKSTVTMNEKDVQQKLELIPYSIKTADRIIAVSQSTKNDIVEIYGINPDKIDITRLAADEIYRKIDPADVQMQKVRGKYGLPEKFILYVGGVYPRKNIARMLQAYAEVKKQIGCSHKFVIVGGNGDNLPDVKECIRKLQLEDDIVYPGYVAIEDMPAIYNLAEVFMHVSLFEGFGLPPLEAMQCGTPTIVSNLTSLPEVVGDAALIADAYDPDDMIDKLKKIIQDAHLRQEYSRRGIEQARKFNWIDTAKLTLESYKKAL